MVADIVVLAAAVEAATGLVKEAVKLAGAIRSGFATNNSEAKQALSHKLLSIEQSLAAASDLARMAEGYIRIRESLLTLLNETQRARHLLVDGIGGFSKKASGTYESDWRVMETLFTAIDGSRAPIQEAIHNRIGWFGERDRNQIEPLLNQFDTAYRVAEQAVRFKAASDTRAGLEQMVRPLQTADALLRNTLYQDILPALQRLNGRETEQ